MPPAVPAGGAPLSCLSPSPPAPWALGGGCPTVIPNPAHLWCPYITPSCSQISLLGPSDPPTPMLAQPGTALPHNLTP